MRQRNFLHNLTNSVGFRHIFFHKPLPYRNIEKQVPNENRCSIRTAALLRFACRSSANYLIVRSIVIFSAFRQQGYFGNRCNGCQRFPPESQCINGFQIFAFVNLTGCMAEKCGRHIFRCNARAIVCNSHISCSAVLDFNGNMLCLCINCIFNDLFHNRGRPFYHLSGCNQL